MMSSQVKVVLLVCLCAVLAAFVIWHLTRSPKRELLNRKGKDRPAQTGVGVRSPAGPDAARKPDVSPEKPSAPGELLTLGAKAPSFDLPDVVTGNRITSEDLADRKVLLVVFMCRHCPYVVHIMDGLVSLGNDYKDKDVAIVGVSANDAKKYRDDSPDKLKEMALEKELSFPLLYDESQETARAFTAVCTPEFFAFDAERKLAYRGQFDDSRHGGDTPVTGRDVRAALDALLAGRPVDTNQKHAIGCSIKWREGNRPPYAK